MGGGGREIKTDLFYETLTPSSLTTIFFSLQYCVSQKEWVWGNQQPYLKMCRHIYDIIFDLMCLLPWALCVTKSCELIKPFWRLLNVDTNKTQNLELLLDAPDFPQFLPIEDFQHCDLCELDKAVDSNRMNLDQKLRRCHLHTYQNYITIDSKSFFVHKLPKAEDILNQK